MNVAGKHAVVTGASRGIGLAIASRLESDGARVSVIGRTRPEGRSFFFAAADVSDEAQVRAALAACRQANGPIEILVNNAGVVETAPVTRTPTAMWDRIIATNLTGTFLCTREVLGEMLEVRCGRIVNVASTAGLGGAPYIAAYCASKHGVVGLTRALAEEIADTGVTVNVICPGYTQTDILDRAVANIVQKTGRSAADALALLASNNPEGRIAGVDEVAQGVLDVVTGSRNGVALVIPGFTEV